MEGPTPVSALIHAATMVTAGVYMIARTHFLFDRSPFALGVGRHRRRGHGPLRRHHRPGPERHQARARLLHHLAARLHVSGLRRRGLLGGHLPSRHPRLLQGPALPRRRLRHPRPRRRAGHAQDGRPAHEAARHLLDHDRGRLRHRRHSFPSPASSRKTPSSTPHSFRAPSARSSGSSASSLPCSPRSTCSASGT